MVGRNSPITPVVILARPQMGENIGAAARAMMNCALSDLRLVKPRDGWPNPEALPMAAGGSEIIDNAIVFESLADATHDVSFMVAASARRRDLPIKSVNPRVAASMLLAHHPCSPTSDAVAQEGLRTAMLFGPEASGLNNDEVVLADVLVTAPLNPDYPSLNLAQAVLLMAWEWRMAAHLEDTSEPVRDQLRKAAYQMDNMLQFKNATSSFSGLKPHLMKVVSSTHRIWPHSEAQHTRAFHEGEAVGSEINTLHGVIQALTRNRK